MIKYASYVESNNLVVSTFLAWEGLEKELYLGPLEIVLELLADLNEVIDEDLTFIIWVGCLFETLNKAHPLSTYFLEYFAKYFECLIVVQLLVKHTKVLILRYWLPALVMMAAVDLTLLGLVLSEVKALLRKHLTAD